MPNLAPRRQKPRRQGWELPPSQPVCPPATAGSGAVVLSATLLHPTSCRWSVPESADCPSLAGRSAWLGFSPCSSGQCLYPCSLAASLSSYARVVPASCGGSVPGPALMLAGGGRCPSRLQSEGPRCAGLGWPVRAVAVHGPGGGDPEHSCTPRGWISCLTCVLARAGETGVVVPAAWSCCTPRPWLFCLAADYFGQRRTPGPGADHAQLQLREAALDHEPGAQGAVGVPQQQACYR